MVDVLQLITDTDRRGPQVAAVELGAVLRARGMSVDTCALARGVSDAPLDVPVLSGWRQARCHARDASVVLAQGSTSLWAALAATEGTRRGFVYRSIGDAGAWTTSLQRRVRFTGGVRRARRVVALWPAAATTLAERFGVRPDRIDVIPQAAPADRFPPVTAAERVAARERLGLRAEGPVALYLGALSEEKRIDDVIAAARRAGVILVVAGDGPLRAQLRSRADDGVVFTGAVDDAPGTIAVADVVVLASRTEGVPGALVEAGLRGLPVVATDVGGVSTVVQDGVTGILVRVGDVDALASGITTAIATPALGARARERCLDAFTLDVVADHWQSTLERAMSR